MGRDEHSSPLMKMETTLTTPRRHTRRYIILTWRTVMAPGSSKVLPSVECPITSSVWARADEIQFQICQIENRFLKNWKPGELYSKKLKNLESTRHRFPCRYSKSKKTKLHELAQQRFPFRQSKSKNNSFCNEFTAKSVDQFVLKLDNKTPMR